MKKLLTLLSLMLTIIAAHAQDMETLAGRGPKPKSLAAYGHGFEPSPP